MAVPPPNKQIFAVSNGPFKTLSTCPIRWWWGRSNNAVGPTQAQEQGIDQLLLVWLQCQPVHMPPVALVYAQGFDGGQFPGAMDVPGKLLERA
jgi:hypothetical protein